MNEHAPKTGEQPEVYRGVGALAVGEFPANWEENFRSLTASDRHDTEPGGLPFVAPESEVTGAMVEGADE